MKTIGKLLPMICLMLFAASVANAQLSISVNIGIAPPALPVYVQPECPVVNDMWVPGYWAYDNVDGYYWVPGVWVAAPNPGLLWTPAYWGFAGGLYGFHAGYWGAHIGFYGGVNYGGGYGGFGFIGGSWVGGAFRYNTAVVHVNTTVITNVYVDRTVINNTRYVNNSHASFNGPGGSTAKPRPEELAAMKEKHVPPTAAQKSHLQSAHNDKSQYAKNNGGHPAAVAMNKVGGTPVNSKGEVAKDSKLGNQKPGAEKAAAGEKAEKPAVGEKPATGEKATKPAAEKPAASKPMAPKPAASKPMAPKPAASKPMAPKPAMKRAAPQRPASKPQPPAKKQK
jgi:hypothetical protein